MLIQLKVENWKSFPKLEFSALAGKERLHRDRLTSASQLGARILPVGAIYGGNASGKTNFFKALEFARRYVVEGVKPGRMIGVKPFALSAETLESPTRFQFEILVGDVFYRYSFTVNRFEVLSERLVEIRRTVEYELFVRCGEQITFGKKCKWSSALAVVAQGTQKNLLFLTNSAFQKREEFRPVYDWFQKTLLLVSPGAWSGLFDMRVNTRDPFSQQIQETLREFDVGIERLDRIEVPASRVPFHVNLQIQREDAAQEEGSGFQIGPYFVHKKDGKQTIYETVAVRAVDGDATRRTTFKLEEESEGARRLVELLPALTALRDVERSRVVFIDEFDRSLHSLVTRKLIEDYLNFCATSSTRSQLFFTTHDALLMDQNLLRRDEIWLVDKHDDRSSLCNLDAFGLRYDKSLVNAYLLGRFGGVPKLRSRKTSREQVE